MVPLGAGMSRRASLQAPIPPPPARFPVGAVVPWSGPTGDVPGGWVLCDGGNGTPDLLGRYTCGAIDDTEVGDVEGGNSIEMSISQTAEHDHDGSMSDAGGHQHEMWGNAEESQTENVYAHRWPTDGSYQSWAGIATMGGHGHGFVLEGGTGGEDMPNEPGHVEVAFIMRVS